MRTSTAAELLKVRTGRSGLVLLTLGVLLGGVTSLSYAVVGDPMIASGAASAGSVTDDIVRAWISMFLFAALCGSLLVTREYGAGSIARSVLLSGGRGKLFAAKAVAGAVAGAVFGLVAGALAVISAFTFPSDTGRHADFSRETWLILGGVVVVNVVAGVWGVLIGWLVRNQVAAVMTLVLTIVFVDPGLQALAPVPAQYLMTVSMSSVYRDVGHQLLPVPWALLVIAGWLAAAWAAGRRLFDSRDVM
jgi:ABC-2 type transport system permease protein